MCVLTSTTCVHVDSYNMCKLFVSLLTFLIILSEICITLHELFWINRKRGLNDYVNPAMVSFTRCQHNRCIKQYLSSTNKTKDASTNILFMSLEHKDHTARKH